MNKIISDWQVAPLDTFTVAMRWNIPVRGFGVVEDIYILHPQVNVYLADYYKAIDKLIFHNNPKPLQKFTGDILIVGMQRLKLITQTEIIWWLFEDERSADLLSRPVYDVCHNEWVEVDDLFSDKNEDYLIVGGAGKLREEYMDALGDISLAAEMELDGGYDDD